MIKTTFVEKPSSYSYFRLNNGMADVFIRVFVHEESNEDGIVYIYNTNEFRVSQDLITEEMVAEDPSLYLDYTPPKSVTELERLEALEAAMLDLMEVKHD